MPALFIFFEYDWLAVKTGKCFLLIFGALLALLSGCSQPLRTAVLPSSPAATASPATATATREPVPSPTHTLKLTSPTTHTATPPSIPSLTPTPASLPCWQEGGRLEQSSLRSDNLRLPMEYTVYLPPCYDDQPERRYPVLYLIHGMNYNNDQWDRLGADEQADALIAAREVSPFIIVLPRDRSWVEPDEDPFGDVLVDELIPFIDQHYRTLPERGFRAVGGLSRGAGWAVHLGLSRWDLFGAIGAHSLPVFWSDTGKVRGWLDAIPPESLPRIYLDIGDRDRPSILSSAQWFENLLTERNIPHEWYLFPGYHEEAYWSAHVEDYLRWYAKGW